MEPPTSAPLTRSLTAFAADMPVPAPAYKAPPPPPPVFSWTGLGLDGRQSSRSLALVVRAEFRPVLGQSGFYRVLIALPRLLSRPAEMVYWAAALRGG